MPTYFPLVVRQSTARRQYSYVLPISEVARLADIHPELVSRLVDFGLLDPVETSPEPLFEVTAVLHLRRIMRLHRDLGVNWDGIGVIMDLITKIEDLERENASLKAELRNR
jgi:DNA-binding transcriptional MerR regulator